MRGICTLQEYDSHYSLADLCDANEALDLIDEQEQWHHAEQEREMKARGPRK